MSLALSLLPASKLAQVAFPRQRLSMRLVSLCVSALVAVAACGPKVDPQSPFDEDDPRAGHAGQSEAATPVVADEPVAPPPAFAGPVVREGTIARSVLTATLDAQPGELLRCFEVAAVEDAGKFAGWRLVRFVSGCNRFDGVDLLVGDVLVSVNGRVLVKPTDLGDLWKDLYTADVIVAELRRGPAPFQLRYTVTAPATTPPASD